MSEIATVRPQAGTPLANALVPSTVEAAMRLAEIMSSANLVPAHLQGKVGDCYLVISQAQRWGMDPVAVAQSTAVVHGKLCYEGKLVSAVLKTSGVTGGRQLQYSFTGDGRQRQIAVAGRLRGEDADRVITGTVDGWATSNEQWKKDPDKMLIYRGTREWARMHAPEVLLGVYTPDEMDDTPVRTTVVQDAQAGLPPYPEDEFNKNFGTWSGLISRGRKSADEVIAMVQTKYTLTPGQLGAIRDLETTEAEVVE